MDLNRFYGAVYGLACGDALGAPTEFMSVEQIHLKFGASGIRDLKQTTGRFTDDTQMTVALAEGLWDARLALMDGRCPELAARKAKFADTSFVMPLIAKRFAEWSESDKNDRAPGTTCMSACARLRQGVDWKRAGVTGSKGCGAAMRVAPLGLVYNDLETLARVTRASARSTHASPIAEQSAHVAALAVHLLAIGFNPKYLLGTLISSVEPYGLDLEFDRLLSNVETALVATLQGTVTPEEVQTKGSERWRLGEAWTADEAVACALYCFLLAHARGEGYVETVRYGANTKGDSDSIACIAGGFAGTHWGVHEDKKGIPVEWVGYVEDGQALAHLAHQLFLVSLSASGDSDPEESTATPAAPGVVESSDPA